MTNPSNAGQAWASRMVALADALAPLPRERLKELCRDGIAKAPSGSPR